MQFCMMTAILRAIVHLADTVKKKQHFRGYRKRLQRTGLLGSLLLG